MDPFIIEARAGDIRRRLYEPAQPRHTLILAHGAGAGQGHPWMRARAGDLADRGVRSVTFDFPYITAGREMPDRAAMLLDTWRTSSDVASRGRWPSRWPSAASRWADAWPRCCWPKRTHRRPSAVAWRSATPAPTRQAGAASGRAPRRHPRAAARRPGRAGSLRWPRRYPAGVRRGRRAREVVDVPHGGHGFEVRGRDARQADVYARVADTVARWLDTLSPSAVVLERDPSRMSIRLLPVALAGLFASWLACAGAAAPCPELGRCRHGARPLRRHAGSGLQVVGRQHRQEGTLTVTTIEMTSQTWRTADEVDRPEWKHYLTVIRPDTSRATRRCCSSLAAPTTAPRHRRPTPCSRPLPPARSRSSPNCG